MISTNTLKQYLNIDGTNKDAFLSVCIASAVSEIETYCNRKFERNNYTDIISGNCNSRFFLKNYPLVSLTSIEYQNAGNWQDLNDSTGFILNDVNAVQLNKTVLPKGKNNIRVSYVAGWDEDECNSDIKNTILELATINYFNSPLSGQARLGKSSENMTSQASASSTFRDLNWKDKVSKYRVRIFK